MFTNKTKKQFITMMSFIACIAFILCFLLGFTSRNVGNKAFASVGTLDDGVEFLETKGWESTGEGDDKCFLLVTGFSAPSIIDDTENTYILGYEINGVDTFDDYGKKYYESVTVNVSGGANTYSAADIYENEAYADYYLIIYEIKAYNPNGNYNVKAFVKQIEPDEIEGYEILQAAYAESSGSPVNVTYNDTPNATFSGESQTLYKEDYTFTVTPDEGYAVNVYANNTLLAPVGTTYTVSGSSVTGDINVLIDAYSTTDVIYDFEDATQPLNKHFTLANGGALTANPSDAQAYAGSYSAEFTELGAWWHTITFTDIRTKIAALQTNPLYADCDVLSFRLRAGAIWQIGDASTYKMFGADVGAKYASGAADMWTELYIPVSAMNNDSFDIYVGAKTSVYIDDVKFINKSIEGGVLYSFEDYADNTDMSSEFGGKTASIATDYIVGSTGKSVKLELANTSEDTLTFTNFFNRLSCAKLANPDADMLIFKVRVVNASSAAFQISPTAYDTWKVFGARIAQTTMRNTDTTWTTVRIPLASVSAITITYYLSAASSVYIDDIKLVQSVSTLSLYSFEDADERDVISANIGSYFGASEGTFSISNVHATTENGYSLKISGGSVMKVTRMDFFQLETLINNAKAIDGATFNTLTFRVYCPIASNCIIGGANGGKTFGYSELEETKFNSTHGWVTISIPLASVAKESGISYLRARYFSSVSDTLYFDDFQLVTL